jgi:hypothetical protein
MSDIDMQGIADRLFGGNTVTTPVTENQPAATRLYPSSAPSTPAADTSTPTPVVEPVAKPVDTPEAIAAKRAALREGVARQNREIERLKTPIEDRTWGAKPDGLAADTAPDAIAELRNTPERRMFNADTFKTHVDTGQAIDRASPLADIKSMAGIDLTQDQLESLKPVVSAELHAIYTDAALTHEEAQTVESVIVDVRTNKVNEHPEADAANAQTAVQQLVERYGKDAQAALDDARAFIARDPRIGKMLDTSRAGNDPRMVLLAVEAARRARARGEKF